MTLILCIINNFLQIILIFFSYFSVTIYIPYFQSPDLVSRFTSRMRGITRLKQPSNPVDRYTCDEHNKIERLKLITFSRHCKREVLISVIKSPLLLNTGQVKICSNENQSNFCNMTSWWREVRMCLRTLLNLL